MYMSSDAKKGDAGSRLMRGISGSFALNVTLKGLYFIVGLTLARILGPDGYGAYAFALSWAVVLGIPASLGLNKLVVREISAYRNRREWGFIGGMLKWASSSSLLASIVVVAVAGAVSLLFRGTGDPLMLRAFWMSLLLIPLVSLMRIRQSVLQGLDRVVWGLLPESLVQPVVQLTFIGAGFVVFSGYFSPEMAVGMHVFAVVAALITSIILLGKALPADVRRAEKQYDNKTWLKGGLALLLLIGVNVINSRLDILMLGSIAGAYDAGVYAIASRGGELVLLFLTPLSLAIAPTVASHFSAGKIGELQELITKKTRLILVLTIPIAIAFAFFGSWFLVLFGEQFVAGERALTILSVGYLLNVCAGLVSMILVMTHHDRDATFSFGIGAVLNVILNALLIPKYGIEGAAVATATSTVVWSMLMAWLVYKRTGIYSTVFGAFPGSDQSTPS
jgi:O-antigen/teichoic acid export membrane protein